MNFDFMPQSSSVEGLLNACMAAMPHLPATEKGVLEKAMREFETFGSPALWSPSDVDNGDDLGLTDGEKREAIGRFIQDYECKESDWMAIDEHARDVLNERQLHLRVEYDPLYTGGDYNGVGKFVLIPLSLIEEFAKQDPDGDDGVELAFTKVTKLDCMHIVHYTLDEQYNQDGELIEHAAEDANDPAVDDQFVCPHCGGRCDIEDSVQTSIGLICDACADGSAVYAAIQDWN
jgi:hypothetical protein